MIATNQGGGFLSGSFRVWDGFGFLLSADFYQGQKATTGSVQIRYKFEDLCRTNHLRQQPLPFSLPMVMGDSVLPGFVAALSLAAVPQLRVGLY